MINNLIVFGVGTIFGLVIFGMFYIVKKLYQKIEEESSSNIQNTDREIRDLHERISSEIDTISSEINSNFKEIDVVINDIHDRITSEFRDRETEKGDTLILKDSCVLAGQ